jgi:hypothetical protein
VAVIELTELGVLRMADVVPHWELTDDTLIVCERFRLVERLQAP